MIENLGYLSLIFAGVASLFSALLCLVALTKKDWSFIAENRVLLILGTLSLTIAFGYAISLLLQSRFEYELVFQTTSQEMSTLQKITAVWGNKSGSLLFWSFLQLLTTMIVGLGKWGEEKKKYFHGVILILQLMNVFFIGLITFQVSPFARLWRLVDGSIIASVFAPAQGRLFLPQEGQGLNPLLKHTAMVIHPPLLYLGFIYFFVPFAFAIVSLWNKDYSPNWVKYSQNWTTLAWVFLSAGILLGCWWAYDILGWGGYWGWDPVEVAGLMPWLSSLGLLHSLRLYKSSERLKRWSYWLIILTVLLIIFGIYLSRTGVVTSVHSYSQSSIGPAFMSFFFALVTISVGSLILRAKDLKPKEEKREILSRPGLHRILNICLFGIVIVCLIGVTLPLTSKAITGTRTDPAQIFYEWNSAPFLVIIILATALDFIPKDKKMILTFTAIAISLSILLGVLYKRMNISGFIGLCVVFFLIISLIWALTKIVKEHTSGKKVPINRWMNILLHLGFALMALGIVGSRNLSVSETVSLTNGGTIEVGDTLVTKYPSGVQESADEQILFEEIYEFKAEDGGTHNLKPQILWYEDTGSTVSSPAIRTNLVRDRYAAIVEWDGSPMGETSVLLSDFPLMIWLWIGGGLMIIATTGHLFSRRERQ